MPQTMTDGQEATRKILEISRTKCQKVQAAQWCYDYVEDGVKQGESFLPSITELKKLFANKVKINASLEMLEMHVLAGTCWSSTEYNNCYAWILHMNSGIKIIDLKNTSDYYVRPVITIKL